MCLQTSSAPSSEGASGAKLAGFQWHNPYPCDLQLSGLLWRSAFVCLALCSPIPYKKFILKSLLKVLCGFTLFQERSSSEAAQLWRLCQPWASSSYLLLLQDMLPDNMSAIWRKKLAAFRCARKLLLLVAWLNFLFHQSWVMLHSGISCGVRQHTFPLACRSPSLGQLGGCSAQQNGSRCCCRLHCLPMLQRQALLEKGGRPAWRYWVAFVLHPAVNNSSILPACLVSWWSLTYCFCLDDKVPLPVLEDRESIHFQPGKSSLKAQSVSSVETIV